MIFVKTISRPNQLLEAIHQSRCPFVHWPDHNSILMRFYFIYFIFQFLCLISLPWLINHNFFRNFILLLVHRIEQSSNLWAGPFQESCPEHWALVPWPLQHYTSHAAHIMTCKQQCHTFSIPTKTKTTDLIDGSLPWRDSVHCTRCPAIMALLDHFLRS